MLAKLCPRPRGSKAARCVPSGVALSLEALEDRWLPSPLTTGSLPVLGRADAAHAPQAVVATWQAEDIAVGSDNQTRLLWANSMAGSANTWTVNNSLTPTAGPTYGSFPNWVAVADAAGANGSIWVLWNNTATGATALWKEDSGGNFVSAGYFGSIGPWIAKDVAVGTDNLPRILWQNRPLQATNSQWCVWTVDSSFNATPGPVYGQFAAFPSRIAAGPDGQFRILGSLNTGAQTIWVVNSAGVLQSTHNFNSPLWVGADIAVGANNQIYLLWTGPSNGTAAIWQIDTSFNVTASFVYGPGGNYTVRAIDVGSDGMLRLLWDGTDGTADLWLVNSNGTVAAQQAYGPF